MTSYPRPFGTSVEPSRFYPRGGEQFWTPQAYNVRRPDVEVGYTPAAYYPSQGYSTAGAAFGRRNSVPWWANPEIYPDPQSRNSVPRWTNPDVYPEPRYYYDEGPDWSSNTRFESSYVSDPQIRGNGRVSRRTWEETAQPDKGYDPAGWYRYKRGQTETPLDRFKSPDVVDDSIDEVKKRKDWLWRRVAVQDVRELTPNVMDGGYIKNYGYIK